MKQFKAIAAMSENRVIGNGPKIPWHLPEDFKFFKAMTTGHVVVMGRTTFESIGRPLPNRETIIVSRSGYTYPGVRTVSSLDTIDVNADERDVFICGGAQIYALALPHCSDLYLTHVKRVVEGDVFFPPFEARFSPGTTLITTPEFDIVHYQRSDRNTAPASGAAPVLTN
ncbi:MAG: dihydrofolate reductase [Gemmatimonadaceae bacterium]|nr:dihydrofolate reductase [Gemmatimonadaceae bacterium]